MVNRHGRLVTDVDPDLIEAFVVGLRGEVLYPRDRGYEEARLVFNTMHDRRPGLLVKASGTADVVDAVNFSRDQDLLMSVRAGGHNVGMNSLVDGGLVIDLTEMCGVFVDADGRRARVQGGATWADVDRETQLHALAAPGGVVSTTGVAGLTLGGGIGWLRGKHGLSCDSLIGAKVVTADGAVIEVSEDNHPDLLWGLKGGGGNFGVVTRLDFALHDVGPTLPVDAVLHPIEEARRILRAWRDWSRTVPDVVTTAAVLWTVPSEPPAFPPDVAGKDFVATIVVYTGDDEEGERVLSPLRGLGEPLLDMSGPWPYREQVQAGFDPFLGVHGQHIAYWKSTYLRDFSDDAIDVVSRLAMNRPDPWCGINIPSFTGAVQRVGPEETAFGDRSAPFMVSIDGIWHDPSRNEANIQWVRDFYDELQPFSTGQSFVNFLGDDEDPEERERVTRAAYATNYERLVDVKTRYDPTNMFRSNQNIRPRS